MPRCCCRRDRNERQRARRLKGGFCRSAWGSLQTSKLETRFQNLGKVVGGLPRFGGFEVVFSSFQGDHNLLAQPRNSKLDFRTQKHIPWTQALRPTLEGSWFTLHTELTATQKRSSVTMAPLPMRMRMRMRSTNECFNARDP